MLSCGCVGILCCSVSGACLETSIRVACGMATCVASGGCMVLSGPATIPSSLSSKAFAPHKLSVETMTGHKSAAETSGGPVVDTELGSVLGNVGGKLMTGNVAGTAGGAVARPVAGTAGGPVSTGSGLLTAVLECDLVPILLPQADGTTGPLGTLAAATPGTVQPDTGAEIRRDGSRFSGGTCQLPTAVAGVGCLGRGALMMDGRLVTAEV